MPSTTFDTKSLHIIVHRLIELARAQESKEAVLRAALASGETAEVLRLSAELVGSTERSEGCEN